jgi:hypothetical protein
MAAKFGRLSFCEIRDCRIHTELKDDEIQVRHDPPKGFAIDLASVPAMHGSHRSKRQQQTAKTRNCDSMLQTIAGDRRWQPGSARRVPTDKEMSTFSDPARLLQLCHKFKEHLQ